MPFILYLVRFCSSKSCKVRAESTVILTILYDALATGTQSLMTELIDLVLCSRGSLCRCASIN